MRMVSKEKGTVAPAAPTSFEENAVTHLFRYSEHQRDTSYSNVIAMCRVVIIPYTSVWSSSSLSMRQRSSTTTDACRPAVEKRCDATKAEVPKSRSASSTDGMQARRTHAAVRRESTKAIRLSSCCARREASAPSQVDASTVPWRFIQGMNHPSAG